MTIAGCDVGRGLGYEYNGTDIDGSGQPWAYGSNPPAIGVVFFQGPYMDADGCDNPSFAGDGIDGPTFNSSCDIVSQDGQTVTMSYGKNNSKSGQFTVGAGDKRSELWGRDY